MLFLLQVMAKLKADATGAKGAIVAALLAASNAHIAARRTANGLDVQHARAQPSLAVRVAAVVMVALTAPLYALAQKLIFSKVGARSVAQPHGCICCVDDHRKADVCVVHVNHCVCARGKLHMSLTSADSALKCSMFLA
jgi:hypothetical protein